MPQFISSRSHRNPRFFVIGSVALLAITTAAYAGTFQNDFVSFDDGLYVTNNPHTLAGLSWAGFRYAWTSLDTSNWTPITLLSYQLDVTLFGARPAAFHATNLVLHCVNVLLLFAWLVRVTGSQWRSLTVAALFAVHPLHVESVAWIAERKDVLSAFWLLIALFAYEKYAMRPVAKWYLATCVAFALGLLSKSMLVTLPLLLLLIDVWPLARWAHVSQTQASRSGASGQTYPQRTSRELLIEKVPLLALSLLDGIVTIIAQQKPSLAEVPLAERIGNSLAGYGWYVAKTLWPTELSMIYLHPVANLAWGRVAVAAVLLAAMSTYVGLIGLRRSQLLFGWLWFLIALLPVIGLLQVGNQAYADRYSYIPHVGFLVMIVWECGFWLDRLPSGRIVAAVAATTATAACAWLTVSQVAVWRTSDTLFAQALAVDPDNWYAQMLIGDLRLETGQLEEAHERYLLALTKNPTCWPAHNNLGRIQLMQKQYERARRSFDESLRYHSQNPEAMTNLGVALKQVGEEEAALVCFRRALDIDPRYSLAIYHLAESLSVSGRLDEALHQYHRALQLSPSMTMAIYDIGKLHFKRKDYKSAEEDFREVLKRDPRHYDSLRNLGLTLILSDRPQEALVLIDQALQIQSDEPRTRMFRASALKDLGRINEARAEAAVALEQLPPDSPLSDSAREFLENLEAGR